MEKRELEFTTRLTREDVAGLIEALVEGLKDGHLKVQKSGESLELAVPRVVDLKIEAEIDEERAEFEIEVSWMTNRAGSPDTVPEEKAAKTPDKAKAGKTPEKTKAASKSPAKKPAAPKSPAKKAPAEKGSAAPKKPAATKRSAAPQKAAASKTPPKAARKASPKADAARGGKGTDDA